MFFVFLCFPFLSLCLALFYSHVYVFAPIWMTLLISILGLFDFVCFWLSIGLVIPFLFPKYGLFGHLRTELASTLTIVIGYGGVMCCQGEEMYWLVDGRVGGQSSQFLFLAIHHRGFGGEVLKRSFHSRPYISRFVLFDVGFGTLCVCSFPIFFLFSLRDVMNPRSSSKLLSCFVVSQFEGLFWSFLPLFNLLYFLTNW